MKLSDIKKLSVKKQIRVAFHLSNGMQCYVDEHGLAKVDGLNGPPGINLEEAVNAAQTFQIRESATRSRSCQRQELEQMVASLSGGAASAAADHDD